MGSRLPPMPKISEIVKLYKLSATKKLSQNFLLDMNVCHKFVQCISVTRGTHICEIGPGPGGITRALLESDALKVHVIEKDPRFIPPLEILKAASGGRLDVHLGDAQKYDIASIFPSNYARPWLRNIPSMNIVGNLPFNVSLGLLLQWLKQISNRSGPWQHGRIPLTLTFQHEVAERLLANRNSPHRCRMTIMCQHLCKVRYRYRIPGKVFVPPPKVHTAVVYLEPLRIPLINQPFSVVEKVTATIFHYRQKYIKRGAQDLFPPSMEGLVDELFKLSDVDPTHRSFSLTMEEWGRLCDTYADFCNEYPGLLDYNYRDPSTRHLPEKTVPFSLNVADLK
ncbi:dimethyladenosine transferase 1, mitochondrial-like [Saccostrea echinata]|uniref:dimethyladenosine transferase 1, mitochondrial-like n=1 Tax=Saccostrea echinata TaxID=191078 RepID=UPI002A80966B|nr:dimethyladenosine transferase 1, mitochondrial-like [Saccostrea echinata]XP_061191176.1 dimethyladenosine transferase 1, mitochondrial-like [Saccostrea echinata]